MPAETWKGNNKKNNQNVKIHFSFFYRKYHTITSFCIVLLDVSWLLSLFTFSSTQVGLRHIYIVNLYFRKRSIYYNTTYISCFLIYFITWTQCIFSSLDKEQEVQQAAVELCWMSFNGLSHACHLKGSQYWNILFVFD